MSVTLQKGTRLTQDVIPFWNACAETGANLEAAGFHGFSIFVRSAFGATAIAEVRWANQTLFELYFWPAPTIPERTQARFSPARGVLRTFDVIENFAEWEQFFREELLDPIEDRIITLLRLRRKIDSNAERLLGLLKTVAQEPVGGKSELPAPQRGPLGESRMASD